VSEEPEWIAAARRVYDGRCEMLVLACAHVLGRVPVATECVEPDGQQWCTTVLPERVLDQELLPETREVAEAAHRCWREWVRDVEPQEALVVLQITPAGARVRIERRTSQQLAVFRANLAAFLEGAVRDRAASS